MEKALVVDDSRLIRKSIRTELEKFSYKVEEAADIAEARKKLAENDYDVVTLDMVLPDGKGLDLCREMKYEQRFEQTTVIIITSLIDDAVRIQCFQNGAFGYFLKNSVREGLGVFLQNVKDFVGTCCFGGMKALLVEDSKLQRNFISGLLKKSGVSPICMENIDSAMDLLKSGSYVPDIVLIDYFFGSGKTSAEFVKFLKKDYNFKNIPIIAMTVSDDREVRNSLFYTGVNDFFHKPFDVEEFYLRLRAHLLNKILLDDMEKTNKLLQLQAITDGLTGIYNRRYFYETLSKEDSRFRRTKEPYSVILFDIDHFKRINDRFGHILGDEVIREIASMPAHSREIQTVLPATAVRSLSSSSLKQTAAEHTLWQKSCVKPLNQQCSKGSAPALQAASALHAFLKPDAARNWLIWLMKGCIRQKIWAGTLW